MRIDVFSDVVCPWCFIGKRRLDAVLAEMRLDDAEVHWHAFRLNPDLPPEGMDRREYLAAKFGGMETVESAHRRIEEAGRDAGVEFRFDLITRSPNTFDAHRLLKLAAREGRQSALKDALMSAYFLEGRDLGDRAVLAAVAAENGLTGDTRVWLEGDGGRDAVQADLAEAVRLGIRGVPFFIFEGHYAFPGAQPPEVFRQALHTAAASPQGGEARA